MSNIIKLNLNGGSNTGDTRTQLARGTESDNMAQLNSKITKSIFDINNFKKVEQDTPYYERGIASYSNTGENFIKGELPKMNVNGIRIGGVKDSYADAGSLDRFWRPKIIDMDDALNTNIGLTLKSLGDIKTNTREIEDIKTEQSKMYSTDEFGNIKINAEVLPPVRRQPVKLKSETVIEFDDRNITLGDLDNKINGYNSQIEQLESKTKDLTRKINIIEPITLDKSTLITLEDSESSPVTDTQKIKLVEFINKTNQDLDNIKINLSKNDEIEDINRRLMRIENYNSRNEDIEKIHLELKDVKESIVDINKIVDYLYKRTA